jgi:hypothetical protein
MEPWLPMRSPKEVMVKRRLSPTKAHSRLVVAGEPTEPAYGCMFVLHGNAQLHPGSGLIRT